jgi:hypothetical protein
MPLRRQLIPGSLQEFAMSQSDRRGRSGSMFNPEAQIYRDLGDDGLQLRSTARDRQRQIAA